jgi:hypothetical protein
MRELYRRIGLALGILAFVWLFFLADIVCSRERREVRGVFTVLCLTLAPARSLG